MSRQINPNFSFLVESYTEQEYNEEGDLIAGERGVIMEGSSRSGKTISAVDFIILLCVRYETNCVINIVKETYNEFKTTLYNDFSMRLNDFGLHNPFEDAKEVSSFKIFKNKINFLGADKPSKFHGAQCDYLYINELLPVSQAIFDQAEMRCKKFWFGDYNPSVTEHWVFNSVIPRPDVGFIRTTFLDNPFLSVPERNKILSYEPWQQDSYVVKDGVLYYDGEIITESNQPPPNLENIEAGTADEFMWKVYGLGLRGAMKGQIFKHVTYVDEFPDLAYTFGLDFGFTCFKGDTMITTSKGQVPIKDIKRGDLVFTRKGYKRVLNRFDNGIKKVITKNIGTDFGFTQISATFEHNFNINNEWKQYGKLKKGDNLYLLPNLMGKHTQETPNGNTQTTFSQSKKKDYIEKFTSILKEKLKKVITFIISTATLLTTIPIIWFLLLLENMLRLTKYLKSIMSRKKVKNTDKKTATTKKTGKKEGNQCSTTFSVKLENVNHAKQAIHRHKHTKGIVAKSVIEIGNLRQKIMTSKKNALSVIRNILQINTVQQKRVASNADINYLGVTELKTESESYEKVYDLHVEDVHEYFANGILVHNCDPTCLVKFAKEDKNIYLELLIYHPIPTPEELDVTLEAVGADQYTPITADSSDKYTSERKGSVHMVRDLFDVGWEISKVSKTKSVMYWLTKMKEYKIHIVRNDLYKYAKREQENYMFKKVNGILINQPEDKYNHFWDACFVGETMISTINGDVKIKDIKPNDLVLTSDGYNKVLDVWDNGVKEIQEYRLQFDKFCLYLKSTKDHKIKTNKGWIKISKLKQGMTVYVTKCLMEKSINYTEMEDISLKPNEKCTGTCGNITTEREEMDFTSTMSMETAITTLQTTWKKLTRELINQIIEKKRLKTILRNLESFLTKVSNLLKRGIKVKKVENGTNNTLKAVTSGTTLTEKKNVNNVISGSLKSLQTQDFVQTIVKPNGETQMESTMKHDNALIAEQISKQINTKKSGVVQKCVLVNIGSKKISNENVYDLHVENIHEYFANGLLVHNCRYAFMNHDIDNFEVETN